MSYFARTNFGVNSLLVSPASPRRQSVQMSGKLSGIDADIHRAVESLEPSLGEVEQLRFQGGSSWSSCYACTTSGGKNLFIKTALNRNAEEMFAGEALGLQAMYETRAFRIPKVYYYGDAVSSGKGSFIIMEYLNFGGRSSSSMLGTCLAKMHLATPKAEKAREGFFGFDVDNTIGGTPQPNAWESDWISFFRDQRLQHQLRLTNDKHLQQLGERLCSNLHVFFDGIEIRPSTLHGDLWSGNIASVDGSPSLFDPATYYGHAEADFGMSWCAGFDKGFWDAYNAIIPKEPGWDNRHDIYQLYHYLNHFNLFGGGYYRQCDSILQRLISKM